LAAVIAPPIKEAPSPIPAPRMPLVPPKAFPIPLRGVRGPIPVRAQRPPKPAAPAPIPRANPVCPAPIAPAIRPRVPPTTLPPIGPRMPAPLVIELAKSLLGIPLVKYSAPLLAPILPRAPPAAAPIRVAPIGTPIFPPTSCVAKKAPSPPIAAYGRAENPRPRRAPYPSSAKASALFSKIDCLKPAQLRPGAAFFHAAFR
jgi:hypothetical protein